MKKQIPRHRDYSWVLEAVLSVFIGVPVYFSLSIVSALLLHLLLAACYWNGLRVFGRSSAIEMFIPVLLILILVAQGAAIYQKLHNKHQHSQERSYLTAWHQGKFPDG